jgi:hypothetical protein
VQRAVPKKVGKAKGTRTYRDQARTSQCLRVFPGKPQRAQPKRLTGSQQKSPKSANKNETIPRRLPRRSRVWAVRAFCSLATMELASVSAFPPSEIPLVFHALSPHQRPQRSLLLSPFISQDLDAASIRSRPKSPACLSYNTLMSPCTTHLVLIRIKSHSRIGLLILH